MDGLGWTFDTQAEQYEKMRPGYVPQLYDDLFAYAGVTEESNALEIGIGGGQATPPILKTGCNVTAVERGAQLAAVCREKFKAYPRFTAIVSKFEDAALQNDAFDLIYSASAFHWVPEEIGYPKVFALLKSGGVFARFANHPYRDLSEGVHGEIEKLYRIYMPGACAPKAYSEQEASDRAGIAQKYGFTDTAYRLYRRTRSFTAKEYTALLGTYSDHIAMEESKRRRFFSEIEAVIDAFGGQLTIYDTLDMQLARKP